MRDKARCGNLWRLDHIADPVRAGVEGAGCPWGEPATASRWIVGLVVVAVTGPSAIELARRVAPFLARRASTASRLDPIARLGMVDDPEPRRGMA